MKIPLTKGQVAIVDDEDHERVSSLKWYAHKAYSKWYALHSVYRRGTTCEHLTMQNFVTGEVPAGHYVDHINGDGLDNRKCNLRIANKSQNKANAKKQIWVSGKPTTSKYKGVYWNKRISKWNASIKVNYKKIFIGHYHDEIKAALAYNKAAIENFGEFANLNVINRPTDGRTE